MANPTGIGLIVKIIRLINISLIIQQKVWKQIMLSMLRWEQQDGIPQGLFQFRGFTRQAPIITAIFTHIQTEIPMSSLHSTIMTMIPQAI